MIKKVYVILTKNNCNANCKFCITNTRDYGDRPQFLKADESFENTLKNLQKIGVQKFELTGGGEPLLNVDYQKIIDTIRKYFKNSYIKFYTNGYKCLPIKNIDELNISAVGLDTNQTNHIICSPSYKPLQKILEFYKNENYKKRISLLAVKCAIDSEQKMAEFVDKTQKYVDEYVVRTTYIGTPFYQELHTDFEYTHPKVVWEKDMCACQSNDTAILFTDNILYSDWNLNHKYIENQKFSNLILIKPDFSTYLDKLLEYIKKNNIKIQKIYKLNDFYNQAQIFYKDFKTPKYFEIVKNHLQSSCELFGNTGLLLVIENSKQTPQKLLD